ncbi:MAG: acyltransferase [Cardiobacteriaceae bacterium]|nr:acyltransferase [Cardiobacteriaceae bacterium]
MKTTTISGKHANNFDAIRLFAAALVLFGHHYPLVGDGRIEPSFLGLNTLGGLAVSIFFTLSGYLVTQSWFADPHPVRFALRRILRIWPALVMVVALSALVLGPLLSTLATAPYFQHETTWRYFSALWMQPAYHLPGVFTTHATPAVNGSLWTIPLEVQCYITLILCGMVGILRERHLLARLALLYIGWYVIWQRPELGQMQYLLEFGAYFAAGAFLFAMRDYWQQHGKRWCVGAALLAVIAWQADLRYFAVLIAVSWLTVFLGQMSTPVLRRAGRFGDFSYGIYLFAFPVQQTVIHLFYPATGFYGSMALAFVITLLCAVLSWHFVEKPALAFKPGRSAANAEAERDVLPWRAGRDFIAACGQAAARRKMAGFVWFATRCLLVLAAGVLVAWALRGVKTPPPLAFFSPDGYPEALARQTRLGMVNVHSPQGLRESLQVARAHDARLQIDFSPLLPQQRPSEHLSREYRHEGKNYPKSFAPLVVNKVKDLPQQEKMRELLAPYWPVLQEFEAQIAAFFLVDEPYMHGIGKAGMAQLAADFRALAEEHELAHIPLGITFSAAMFDAGFAETVSAAANAWVHGVESYYQRLLTADSADEKAELAQWEQAFAAHRLTTYDLAGHYYTGGGIPKGYDIVAYDLYTATLLQDSVQARTLAWFAELGASPACERFRDKPMAQIRSELSFYQNGAVVAGGLEKDRPLLDSIFACKSESVLHLLQKHATDGQRFQLWGESSSNGFLEFDAQGNMESEQPALLVAARVQDEVERTLRFYDRHAGAFSAGVMFFTWDDTHDNSIDLQISGARSLPGVTRLVFDRIGKSSRGHQ